MQFLSAISLLLPATPARAPAANAVRAAARSESCMVVDLKVSVKLENVYFVAGGDLLK